MPGLNGTPSATPGTDPANPAETNGAAVDPPSPSGAQVDPETPNVDDKAKAKTPEELQAALTTAEQARADAEAKAKAAEERADAAYKSDRKRREALNEERKEGGKYQELYSELDKEHATLATEHDSLKSRFETLEAENKAQRKQLDGFKASWIERFDEADRELAAATPLDKLPALFERLNPGAPSFAPPSHGINRVPQRPAPKQGPTSREEYNRQMFGNK